MFCHMCGQKQPENARFCSKCGTAVEERSSQITREYREKVYNELYEVIPSGLDNGEISVVDSKDIANVVLGRLDDINTKEELDEFLAELIQMWPIYQTVVEKLRKDATSEDHEQQSQAAPPGSGDEFIQRVQRFDEAAKNGWRCN